jgi:hypothetical protein
MTKPGYRIIAETCALAGGLTSIAAALSVLTLWVG